MIQMLFKPKTLHQIEEHIRKTISNDLVDDILFFIYEEKYLEAVKQVKFNCGLCFYDSKQLIDNLTKENEETLLIERKLVIPENKVKEYIIDFIFCKAKKYYENNI